MQFDSKNSLVFISYKFLYLNFTNKYPSRYSDYVKKMLKNIYNNFT